MELELKSQISLMTLLLATVIYFLALKLIFALSEQGQIAFR